jgi:hypothetical protein
VNRATRCHGADGRETDGTPTLGLMRKCPNGE